MSPFLSLRAIIPMLLVFTAVVASLGGFFYMKSQGVEEVEKDSVADIKQIMNILQSSVNVMLRRGDLDGIRIQLTSLATNKDNVLAVVVDNQGKVLLSSSRELEGKPFRQVDKDFNDRRVLGSTMSTVSLSEDRQYVHAVYLLNIPDEQDTLRAMRTGYLVMKRDISTDILLEQALTIKHATTFLSIMIVLSVLMWIVFHFLITRRVDQLLKVTNKVSGGDLSARSGMRGKDEFSSIARALDNMAINLAVNQRELIASEERLRLSQEYANIGAWEWNINTDTVYWSETIPAMFGTGPENVQTYDDFIGFVHPEDVENLEAAIQRCLNSSEKYDFQHRIIRPDGEQRWVHDRGDVLRSPVDGSPSRMFGVVSDITRQKEAEIQLQSLLQELKYQKYAMDQHAIVSITDLSGKINYVNEKFCELSGYSKDELLGETHRIVNSGFHSEEFFREMWRTIESGKTWHNEMCNASKSGEIFWLDTTIVPLFDDQGKPNRYIAMRTDITDRKRADARLHLQASALEAAADGIVITDISGRIQWVNSAYTELTGYSFDESVGQNQRMLNSGKHDKAFFKELWDTILSKNMWHGEVWNKRKNGIVYLEEETITPVLDTNGEVENFIAIKRDVSERRKLHQQLQQAQKMEAVGQLTGGIAHDFNNMLASVLGYTEMLVDEVAEIENEKVKNYLDQVYKAGCRARDLVAQMLAFSRGGDDELTAYALAPLIRESVVMLASTLPSSVEIELQIESSRILILTSPVQFHQMIMNLCINARDAMNGKGVITIGLKKVDNIEAECCSCHEKISGEYVRFYVSDTGNGIKSDQLSRLFDPFYSTKDVGKGTGMGLSIVHGIMHSHNGHILVDAEQGKGTTFSLLFPLIKNHEKGNVPALEYMREEPAQKMSGHILVVDDEVSVARFLQVLFEEHGCKVTVENDSRSALATFKSNPSEFDLVVTDQTMPRLTGDELAIELLAERPELPIILCTGFSEKVDEARAASLGIKGYIEKPIETAKFLMLATYLLESNAASTATE